MFTIFNTVGGISGAFSNVASGQRLTTINGDGSFLVNYGTGSPFPETSIVLSSFIAVAFPAITTTTMSWTGPTTWCGEDSLGQTGSGLAADGNGNNQIDAGDFGIWRGHFGQTAGSGLGASPNGAVPEPAPAAMLILAAACRCFRRR